MVLKILKQKKFKLKNQRLKKFYKVHETKPFYSDLCSYLSSGPIVVMVSWKRKCCDKQIEN